MKKIILILLYSHSIMSQVALLDTNTMLIGDQITLNITSTFEKDEEYKWPMFTDTISKNIEIISQNDTIIQNDDSSITRLKDVIISEKDSIIDSDKTISNLKKEIELNKKNGFDYSSKIEKAQLNTRKLREISESSGKKLSDINSKIDNIRFLCSAIQPTALYFWSEIFKSFVRNWNFLFNS